MRTLIAYLIAFFIVGAPATTYAQPKPAVKVGDTAKNLQVLPPWTMRLCPKEFYATYDMDGAKQLKLLDNDCNLWKLKQLKLGQQLLSKDAIINALKALNESHTTEHKQDEARIQDLVKQVKDEIAEKNKYKYQPNYSWLWISIGAAIAIAGVCFGVGVWLAKDNN